MTSDIENTMRSFLSRFIRNHELKDDEDIFAAGFVNSMFAMQLVQFIEHQFGFDIESEDLELDHFRSIEAMTRFIERKKNLPTSA
jgi:methoxymalonate biosynthesis acyl carrier protein